MKNKNTILLAAVGLIVLLVLSWYTMFRDAGKLQDEYDGYLSAAHEYLEQVQPDAASEQYLSALELHDSLELREEMADFYLACSRTDSYLELCDQTISVYPKDDRAYARIAAYHLDVGDYKSCRKVLERAKSKSVGSERLNEITASLNSKELSSEALPDS